MRDRIRVTVVVLAFVFLVTGCREKESPSSGSTPTPTVAYDSIGLGGTVVQTLSTDGRRFFAGTANGMYRSLDSGANWQFTPSISGRTSIASIVIAGPNILAGTDSNLSISFNDGTNWTNYISPLRVYALVRRGTFVFAATGSGIIRSSNNGVNWTFVNTGLPPTLPDGAVLEFEDSTVCLGFSNAVYISSNNGTTWNQASPAWSQNTVTSVFVSANIFYVGTTGGMFSSRTQGTTWIRSAVGIPDTSHVVSMVSVGSSVYAGTNNAGVFISGSGGITWITSNLNLPDLQITALAAEGRSLYAATRRKGIWRTTP